MIGSLFSGIGGLELGLEWAGLGPVSFQVEIDPFCRRVLAKHWPDATRHEDVKTVGANNLPRVDLICGGFPCQDVSSAGAGAGLKHGTRSGLWYEYLRIVSELRPARVVVENVASGAKRWLCEVRGNLHAIGYRTRAFALSAADVGAPHLRKRIFVVASDAYPYSELAQPEHAEVASASAFADAAGKRRVKSNETNPPGRPNDLRSRTATEGFGGSGLSSDVDAPRREKVREYLATRGLEWICRKRLAVTYRRIGASGTWASRRIGRKE